ncbi:superoxide dismutase [Cu-Zn]-like isoform X3 [Tachypleus tridentatus]|uniref:superoxide dismutase [Cu-Zn]-like isoform X3 n=1 Tax=Tachypleus tridentatus TaxID=6853 RepID=UPI003FD5CA34
MSVKAVAVLTGEKVKGAVFFSQEAPDCPVTVTGKISGLSKGFHGFHVHEYGDNTNGCVSAGGHFNPFNQDHGAPGDQVRTSFCCGTVSCDPVFTKGAAIARCLSNQVLVHADQDDLGRGGHELSKTTGNAGGRVACGVIGITK